MIYDYPEIHEIRKEETLYYGIFIKKAFSNQGEFRSLASGKKYRLMVILTRKFN